MSTVLSYAIERALEKYLNAATEKMKVQTELIKIQIQKEKREEVQ